MSDPATRGRKAAEREARGIDSRAEELEQEWEYLLDQVDDLKGETDRLLNDAAISDDASLRYAAKEAEDELCAARGGVDGLVMWLRKMRFDARE